jgi:16S rRNA (cytosine1402-N4)-methyltransferase
MTGQDHIPVLLEEVLGQLGADRAGVYLDCTLGLGGHSSLLLKSNPKAELVGIDRDESSLEKARDNLAAFADRVKLYHSDFRYLPELDLDFSRVRGVLVDLGLSSFQLDDSERGFSFNQEGPLDMRMDQRSKTTAARILDRYSEPRLAQVFRDYGELRQAKKLASAVVSRRKIQKFETTTQLFHIVEQVCHWRAQKGKSHPAARVFQALRIEVNEELQGLDAFLRQTAALLSSGARIAVISFHSLEDRIVKHTFAALAASDEEQVPLLTLLTKKPIVPSPEEVSHNFRSRSAKLRAAERL